MLRKTSLLILLLLLAAVPVSAAAWGETWKWNEFNADYEKFYYESSVAQLPGTGSSRKMSG